MPFETLGHAPRRIAVIGGGISGMGAAHLLGETNHVVLFEAETRLGGHARTKIAGKRGDQPVDTGFIVFNYANYPYLTSLFHRLGVPIEKSDMSFGASIRNGWLEYGLSGLDGVFAQKRNLARPQFWKLISDVYRFNRDALSAADDPEMTIGDLIEKLRLGSWFRDYYLTPFSGAIWSTPVEKILDFPATAMIEFFKNHNLLHHTGQHQWYTVQGGSQEYVTRLGVTMERQGIDLRLGAPVAGVRRIGSGVEVRAHGGDWEFFDDVVFGCHSDQALGMLVDADEIERSALGAIRYQPNTVVLHADARMMPHRRACWSSWNYTEGPERNSERIDLTYWMNKLQPSIPQDDPMFVTLNTTREIDPALIYDETVLHHPVYDLGALAAQKVIAERNGHNSTWFCGAWMKNGFHEDGLASAVDVVEALTARDAIGVAAQ